MPRSKSQHPINPNSQFWRHQDLELQSAQHGAGARNQPEFASQPRVPGNPGFRGDPDQLGTFPPPRAQRGVRGGRIHRRRRSHEPNHDPQLGHLARRQLEYVVERLRPLRCRSISLRAAADYLRGFHLRRHAPPYATSQALESGTGPPGEDPATSSPGRHHLPRSVCAARVYVF
ncbi:hypothetical protein O1611_g10348 [Lasiodiplodia mahajangana]|uniref:Uncharacterized protein n=1 Tax=Lasiodiplodia mahajangana TaxID=1108764 RepID=A0ACC2IZF7_9PEZI|nr:hypothetical protein O1611_g10348 [Lasiodiplodia mahajangana]